MNLDKKQSPVGTRRPVRISVSPARAKAVFFLLLVLGTSIRPAAVAEESYYVAPLLKTTWGQRGDHATLNGVKRLGCWSVAVAQVMYYHKCAPVGTKTYDDGRRSITSRKINWNLIAPSLKENVPAATKKETSRYCFYAALTVGYNFETDTYDGNTDVRRKSLHEHYNVATQRYRIDREGKEVEPVKKAIASELRAGRPLVLYVESSSKVGHALVIDGLDTREGKWLVRLNFGWQGESDGWYEFLSPFVTRLAVFDDKARWVMAIRPNAPTKP